MEREEAKKTFTGGAHLIDPLYLFESQGEPAAVASAVFEACERMSGEHKETFYRWASSLGECENRQCFFGSSLTVRDPGDIDMLAFGHAWGALMIRKPGFVHIFDISRVEGDLAAGYASLFLGPLLFPGTPPESVQNVVEHCRGEAFRKPFFGGGYGEPMTYAAYRAIGREDLFEPHEWEAARGISGFKVDYSYFDGTNMRMVPYTIHETHSQIREKLSSLDEREMRALAMAATRRLGIKEEHREALADRFAYEIKRMKR